MEKKYRVKIRDANDIWVEELSLDVDNPISHVHRMIESYNKYLRYGETTREFVEIIGLVNGGKS